MASFMKWPMRWPMITATCMHDSHEPQDRLLERKHNHWRCIYASTRILGKPVSYGGWSAEKNCIGDLLKVLSKGFTNVEHDRV
jgi:hypothetical protein